MKSILYIGAALMTGASIYGFIDYRKSSQKEDFSRMYDTKEVIIPKEEVKVTERPAETIEVKNTSYSHPKSETVKPTSAKAENTKGKVKKSTAKKNRTKKLDPEIFSRAPLKPRKIVKEL